MGHGAHKNFYGKFWFVLSVSNDHHTKDHRPWVELDQQGQQVEKDHRRRVLHNGGEDSMSVAQHHALEDATPRM